MRFKVVGDDLLLDSQLVARFVNDNSTPPSVMEEVYHFLEDAELKRDGELLKRLFDRIKKRAKGGLVRMHDIEEIFSEPDE